MSNKILFLFTQSFPYGKEETFIKEEIQFMLKYFDKVLIISNTKSNEIREIPKSIDLHTISSNKLKFKDFIQFF